MVFNEDTWTVNLNGATQDSGLVQFWFETKREAGFNFYFPPQLHIYDLSLKTPHCTLYMWQWHCCQNCSRSLADEIFFWDEIAEKVRRHIGFGAEASWGMINFGHQFASVWPFHFGTVINDVNLRCSCDLLLIRLLWKCFCGDFVVHDWNLLYRTCKYWNTSGKFLCYLFPVLVFVMTRSMYSALPKFGGRRRSSASKEEVVL
jgi:hypothetical protein